MNFLVSRLIGTCFSKFRDSVARLVGLSALTIAIALTGFNPGLTPGGSVVAEAQAQSYSGKRRHIRRNYGVRRHHYSRKSYRRHNVRRGSVYRNSTNYKNYLPRSHRTYQRKKYRSRNYHRPYRNYKYYGPQRRHYRRHRGNVYINGRRISGVHNRSFYNQRSNHPNYRSYDRKHYKVIKRVVASGLSVEDQKLRQQALSNAEVVNDHPSDPSVIFYNGENCQKGYDCVMRLGDSPSSPKIIVLGENRKQKKSQDQKPDIVYPPIN